MGVLASVGRALRRWRGGGGAPPSLPAAPAATAGPVTYPYFEELLLHLELRPYLTLDAPFDHAGCFAEAMALEKHFVGHRNYGAAAEAHAPKWRSLALRALGGDATRTLYHADYGVTGKPEYENTWVAERCPKTMAFLHSIVDVAACERIRFMLLEPGARIHVHRDNTDGSVAPALNIALNMPAGCRFVMETDPLGHATAHTVTLPFRDGTSMLVNVGKFHYVVNDSPHPRIHIIAHGPLRYSREQLVARAEAQNGARGEKELVQAVIEKMAADGEAAPAAWLDRWRRQGILREAIAKRMRVAVLDPGPALSPPLREECLRITTASLWPLHLAVVEERALDTWIAGVPAGEAVALVGAGTYVPDLYRFCSEALAQLARMRRAGAGVSGHLLHFAAGAEGEGPLPALSEQFLLVDTAHDWVRAGPVGAASPGTARMEFPEHARSPESYHDGYTPHWMRPGAGVSPSRGQPGWGTALLARSLGAGAPVLGLGEGLRAAKIFAYPKKEASPELAAVRRTVGEFLAAENRKVYHLNNEPYALAHYPGFRADRLWSVAAGLKPFALAAKWLTDDGEVTLLDRSAPGLRYVKALAAPAGEAGLVAGLVAEAGLGEADAWRELEALLKEGLAEQRSRLRWAQGKVGAAAAREVDFVANWEGLVADLAAPGKCLFWHSNAWNSNASHFSYSPAELRRRYSGLGAAVARARGTRAWLHHYHFELIVGDTPAEAQVVLTDGNSGSEGFRPEKYQPVGEH